MNIPTLADVLTSEELEFLRQLFDSDIAVTLKNVEVVAGLKRKVHESLNIPKKEGTGTS